MTLFEKTIDLIENRSNKITLQMIADECDMSLAWICKMKRGAIKSPSVHVIEKIYTYLNGEGLDLWNTTQQ